MREKFDFMAKLISLATSKRRSFDMAFRSVGESLALGGPSTVFAQFATPPAMTLCLGWVRRSYHLPVVR